MFGRRGDRGHDGDASPPASAPTVCALTAQMMLRGRVGPGISTITLPEPEGAMGSWPGLDLRDVAVSIPGGPEGDGVLPSFVVHGDGVLALAVLDGLDAPALRVWSRHAHPVAGVFHLGPLRVEGTMLRIHPDRMDRVMPVRDARLVLAGPAGTAELTAPLVLVNTRHLLGYEPA